MRLMLNIKPEVYERMEKMLAVTSTKTPVELIANSLAVYDCLITNLLDNRQIRAVKIDDPISITVIDLGFELKDGALVPAK